MVPAQQALHDGDNAHIIYIVKHNMSIFCAFCYVEAENLLTCGKCKKRKFCSKDCQKADWKLGHRLYCGISGELGHDYEIRQVDDNVGMGVFALRDFTKNEKVMVERPLLKWRSGSLLWRFDSQVPESARKAVAALVPIEGSQGEKMARNGMSCTEGDGGETGLFVSMSRINHECMPNADHQFLHHRGVKILVASRVIRKGEQMTISYTASFKPRDARRAHLAHYYSFNCNCSVCNDPTLERKLNRAHELDERILQLASSGNVEAAMRNGRALLQIYNELSFSSWLYQRSYYDLFQVAITKKRTVSEGRKYIRLAYEAVLAYTSDDQHPEVKRL